MWRFIKWLVFLSMIACVVLAVTGYKIKGKTIQEYAEPYLQSKVVKEGIRDVRSILGEGLKAAGEAISEDVTDSERKELDNLLKQEMLKGTPIEGVVNQRALPPEPIKTLPTTNPVTKPQTEIKKQ